jgi:arabinose-5-phosphate isomerase
MTAAAARQTEPVFDRLAFGRSVLRTEAAALAGVAEGLSDTFTSAVDLLFHCAGRVAVTGVGKSADVGQKLVGTLNSTGTRAYLLDATKAVHGDLGMVHPDDVAILFSHSGESEELVRLLGPLKALAAKTLAITGRSKGTVGQAADVCLSYGPVTEACPNALAPSTSTTVMLALGDALALTLSRLRQFSAADFAKYHPSGSLGKQLATVSQLMRTGPDVRIASEAELVRNVFSRRRGGARRTGAVMLVNASGTLTGFFTDSDLARLFETRNDTAFDRPVAEVMTRDPMTVPPTARLRDAVALLRGKKISELPVVDDAGKPVGLLDITDVIGTPEAGRPTLRLFEGSAARTTPD